MSHHRHHPHTPGRHTRPAATTRRSRYGAPLLSLLTLGAASGCSYDEAERTISRFPRAYVLPVVVLAVLAVMSACGSAESTTPASPADTAAPTTTPATTSPAASTTTTTIPTTDPPVASPRPTDARDGMVQVDGASVHLRCAGSGDTTVVLIAGFEGDSSTWGAVEAGLAGPARVCAYDRPGTGTSSPATGVTTFVGQADLLHDLLEAAGEPGPYVAVGHSFGGAEATEFAVRYSSEVRGLALVDASPAGWADALCAVPADGTQAAAGIGAMCAGWADPTTNVEHLDAFAAFDELAAIASLGNLPVEVLTAAERTLPADIAPAERERLNRTWNAGQRHWVQLSSAAQLTTVDDTGHHIEIDQPQVVVDAVERLLP